MSPPLACPFTLSETTPSSVVTELLKTCGRTRPAGMRRSPYSRASRVGKPLAGHLAKAAVEAGHVLKEFRAKPDQLASLKVGGKIGVEIFKVGQKVDVQGVTIGKGFAGVIKRHHFSGQNASHGNSLSHRVPGSTGQNQSPAHVFKGKRMPGHLGNVRRTISGLVIVRIDPARQLLLVKGSVPGSSGRDVVVRPAVKA